MERLTTRKIIRAMEKELYNLNSLRPYDQNTNTSEPLENPFANLIYDIKKDSYQGRIKP